MTYQKLIEGKSTMKAQAYSLKVESKDAPELIDITDEVRSLVEDSGV